MKILKHNFIILIVSILLCGCAKQNIASKTEIVFWTLQLSSFRAYIESVIAEYETLHPDVKIKWVDVPFSEGEKRALASVLSKKTPDLINLNPNFTTTLASKGALTDLNTYVKQTDYDKYIKETWNASSFDDKLYGIPWYVTSAITIYNTDILNKSEITQVPRTYDELGDIATIIKNKTGKYALMPSLCEGGKTLKLFNKYDIPIIDITNKTALFNTKKAAKILDFWADMYDKTLIPPESITQGHRAALEKYQSGETAFIVVGANFLKIIKENAPQIYKSSEITQQLTGSNNKVDFSLMNLVVPKKSKNPEVAVDFGLFLTNHKNQLAFCKLAPVLPSTKETIDNSYFKLSDNDKLSRARVTSAQQLKRALTPVPVMNNQKDLHEIIDFMTQSVLLKKSTPSEALNKAVTEWNKILK